VQELSARLIAVLASLLSLAALACMPEPPVLASEHEGWRKPDCFTSDCHDPDSPPLFHEQDMKPLGCIECHGANGACVPDEPGHEHVAEDDCVSCHMENHGYTSTPDCFTCHYAESGSTECTDA
jgi:hypothetical protein